MDHQSLDSILGPPVRACGFEYVGYEYIPGILRVFIDNSKGITTDDCSQVSRQISAILDIEDPIPGPYALEVSSPGIERPLFSLAQYERFVGQRIAIRLRMPRLGQRNFTGYLQAVQGTTLILQREDQGQANNPLEIEYEDIVKGHLVADFKVC